MMCSYVALKHGHREPEQAVKKAKGILNINREAGVHTSTYCFPMKELSLNAGSRWLVLLLWICVSRSGWGHGKTGVPFVVA